jgi:carbon-monoxide dehydrogenase large subunit
VFTREESNGAIRRHACTVRIKTGVKRDGTLTAREITAIWDGGAYAITGPNISINAGASAPGPYRCPNLKIDSYNVYTNTSPAGSFRGFGTPQVTWACESQMDEIAEALGLDPLELRLKNRHQEGDPSPTGEILRGVGMRETLEAAAEAIGWGTAPPSAPDRGIGFACGHKVSNSNSSTVAYVAVQRDGSVQLFESVMDSGPGEDTTLSQIAAEELAVPFESIALVRPDTDSTPHDFGTVSSRITFCAGEAVRLAAAEAKHQLIEQAAKMLEVNIEDVEWLDARATVRGVPSGPSLSIAELGAQYFFDTGGNVFGKGTFKVFGDPPDQETGQTTRLAEYWMYVAQAAEVEVDRETGEVRVLRLVGANDSGRTINPVHAQSQIQGGLIQGLGYTLSEQMAWDERGKFITHDFQAYGAPTALDVPATTGILVEVPHPEGPFGAKGMAEAGLIPTAPAIANAIYRAVGVRIKELPITPERVLNALRAKEAAAAASRQD